MIDDQIALAGIAYLNTYNRTSTETAVYTTGTNIASLSWNTYSLTGCRSALWSHNYVVYRLNSSIPRELMDQYIAGVKGVFRKVGDLGKTYEVSGQNFMVVMHREPGESSAGSASMAQMLCGHIIPNFLEFATRWVRVMNNSTLTASRALAVAVNTFVPQSAPFSHSRLPLYPLGRGYGHLPMANYDFRYNNAPVYNPTGSLEVRVLMHPISGRHIAGLLLNADNKEESYEAMYVRLCRHMANAIRFNSIFASPSAAFNCMKSGSNYVQEFTERGLAKWLPYITAGNQETIVDFNGLERKLVWRYKRKNIQPAERIKFEFLLAEAKEVSRKRPIRK